MPSRRTVGLVPILLGLLAACGASQPRGTNFHATDHHYSVRQVEEVFAAQHVKLRREEIQQIPGVVVLYREKPGAVTIAVNVAHEGGSTFVFLSAKRGEHGRFTRHGNVVAYYDHSDASAVAAALAQLH